MTTPQKCANDGKAREAWQARSRSVSHMKTMPAPLALLRSLLCGGTCFMAGVLALGLFLAGGCATKQTAAPKKYVFFPGTPDPPRLQYLVSYSSERDLGGANSGFFDFVTGQKPVDKPIIKPYGLALRNGKLYVCDSGNESVLVLDIEKRHLDVLPMPEDTPLGEPVNIDVEADGTHYIVDDKRDQVLCLDASNQLKSVIGLKDEMRPRDVAVSGDRLYVADLKGHCVRVYDKETQKPLFTIPNEKDARNSGTLLLAPSNIAIDPKGQLYASDIAAGRVQVYDKAGNYVRTIGGFGDEPQHGLLKRPKGVAVDHDGIVYVVDNVYQLVQMFDDQGHYLMCFGYPGSGNPAGMTLPVKVMVDYDNVKLFEQYASPHFKIEYLVVVSNQFGARKVAVYGFGHER